MSEVKEYVPSMIKADEMNSKFKYEISKMPGAEKIMLCFQCGTCTADCPISRFSDLYQPRRIAHMIQLGLKDRLLSDEALWLCSTCFTCIDHCPQGVEIASLVRVLRNLVVKEKKVIPLVYKELATTLMKTGYVYVIPESRHKRRGAQGLPPLPKPNVEQIAKIFEVTGFTKMFENLKTFEKVESK
ncbi:4Fe-4S dicluster domain-containing protein [Candidatus Bathyarchaeota archaeon]|nr:4Fe-4S dicluster domain-containing protein [Candidatus Bathyarchaeota archaeon]